MNIIRKMHKRKKNIRWNTMRILTAGFLLVILVGAFLLWLPISNQKPIAFIDALFTAVSAVCVTGLVTIVPQTQFTIFGKVILLILIQIGGLGIIACVTAFFFILKKQITVRERMVIQEAYNADALGGIVGMVRRILMGTAVVEGAGAVFYAFQFVPEYGWIHGVWYSIFHSISAFCNAGIDILGTDSLAKYIDNPIMNITTMLLIILGGIGFNVWFDVLDNGRKIRKKEVPGKWWFKRLQLHSKLAIVTTVTLIIAGTVLTFLLEYHNPNTIGDLKLSGKLLASAFQSVTTRTAGYSTFSQVGMHEETRFLNILLMFIGGSPGGTAGGVKTTTIAMLILTCIALIRGGQDTECFGRRISAQNIRMGFATLLLAFMIYLSGTIAIAVFEPDSVSFLNIMYETSSALGTVGLTADLTPHLCRASQVVIMLMMYIGRLGAMTIALLFAGKANPKDRIRTLPTNNILVG